MILISTMLDDMMTRVQSSGHSSLPADNIKLITSESDLLDKVKLITPPFCGVMYEGLRANASGDQAGMGRATNCHVAVVLGTSTKAIGGFNSQSQAMEILDAVRDKILGYRSPSQHRWSFISESYVGDIKNVCIYIQRWSAPVILAR